MLVVCSPFTSRRGTEESFMSVDPGGSWNKVACSVTTLRVGISPRKQIGRIRARDADGHASGLPACSAATLQDNHSSLHIGA